MGIRVIHKGLFPSSFEDSVSDGPSVQISNLVGPTMHAGASNIHLDAPDGFPSFIDGEERDRRRFDSARCFNELFFSMDFTLLGLRTPLQVQPTFARTRVFMGSTKPSPGCYSGESMSEDEATMSRSR